MTKSIVYSKTVLIDQEKMVNKILNKSNIDLVFKNRFMFVMNSDRHRDRINRQRVANKGYSGCIY